MLIISGTAECIKKSDSYRVGEKHSLTMFSQNEVLEDNLEAIETKLNGLGWDNIVIEETSIISDSEEFDHQILKDGYNKATKQGLAFVVNVTAMEEATAA